MNRVLYLIGPISSKDGIDNHKIDTANTMIIICIVSVNFDLDIALITPSNVPGVPDQPVVQASGCISAVADHEHGMVYKEKVFWIV